MRKITCLAILTFIGVLFSDRCLSQTTQNISIDTSKIPFIDDSDFYPEFPGGNKALQQYLISHTKYPKVSIAKNIEGRVMKIIIKRDGSIGKVTVLKSVSTDIDNEAIRVVKGMPKWRPRMHNWKKISSAYMLPITFALH